MFGRGAVCRALALTASACAPSTPPLPEAVLVLPATGRATASEAPGAPPTCTAAARAWLVLVDASERMRARFDDVRRVARAFVHELDDGAPKQVRVFAERSVLRRTPWSPSRGSAERFIDATSAPRRAEVRHKDLVGIVGASLGAMDELDALDCPPRATGLVLVSDGNGALGSEARAASVGRLLAERQIAVVVLWVPTAMPEELYEHAREVVESLAQPDGVLLEVPAGVSDAAAATLARNAGERARSRAAPSP